MRPVTPESISALARAAYRPIGPVLAGHKGRLMDLAYSPDGRLIVTASDDGTARLWNADTGTVPLSWSLVPEGFLSRSRCLGRARVDHGGRRLGARLAGEQREGDHQGR